MQIEKFMDATNWILRHVHNLQRDAGRDFQMVCVKSPLLLRELPTHTYTETHKKKRLQYITARLRVEPQNMMAINWLKTAKTMKKHPSSHHFPVALPILPCFFQKLSEPPSPAAAPDRYRRRRSQFAGHGP